MTSLLPPRGRELRQDILELVAEFTDRLGFEPTVAFAGLDAVVAAPIATHLRAVLREALSNVVRHAFATQVDISIRVDSDLALRVVDNGRGGAVQSGRGNGLRNVVERARALGGFAAIEPSGISGTELLWVVPVPD